MAGLTELQYARMIIADKDTDDYLFTDEELQFLLNKNKRYQRVVLEPITPTVFEVLTPYTMLSTETYVITDFDGNPIAEPFTVDAVMRTITFSLPPAESGLLYLQGKFLDEDNFRADALSMIVVDFRKLQSFSIQNMNGNLNDAKEHLFRLIRYFRVPR